MTIEEAIRLNGELLRTGNYDVEPKFTKAIKLGIEALKNFNIMRELIVGQEHKLLPGETKE